MENEIVQAPLFPLPGMVFFPHSIVRLHIFEERYKQMTRDSIAGSEKMLVGMLKPGWEPSYYDSPPVYRICGLGRIVDHQEHDDGKFDITLEGICRVVIREEVQHAPYRIVSGECLNGTMVAPDDVGQQIHRSYRTLLESADRMVRLLPQFKNTLQKILAAHPHPGVVADLLTHYFIEKSYEKQCILEEENCLRRINLVNIQLNQIVENYARVHFRDRL